MCKNFVVVKNCKANQWFQLSSMFAHCSIAAANPCVQPNPASTPRDWGRCTELHKTTLKYAVHRTLTPILILNLHQNALPLN